MIDQPSDEDKREIEEQLKKAGMDITIDHMLAYQGKKGCRDGRCTQFFGGEYPGHCYGWHCAVCDEPCSSQGHYGCEQLRGSVDEV